MISDIVEPRLLKMEMLLRAVLLAVKRTGSESGDGQSRIDEEDMARVDLRQRKPILSETQGSRCHGSHSRRIPDSRIAAWR